jgi:cyanophycinase-like exopeptidase
MKSFYRMLVPVLLAAFAAPALAAKTTDPAKKLYTYLRVGATADAVGVTAQPGTVLMGGGTDVDAAFQWMCAHAVGGDFLVVRATGTDAYNPYVQALCPNANSVATLIVASTDGANRPEVAEIVAQAEMVWIAGGDQSNYVNYWTGTAMGEALRGKVGAVPVGGTSAGLNVLTQYVYSAQASQGVTSSQALANPFNKYMSFAQDFVATPYLQNVIGDPHFAARDRMGRDLAFLCRVNLLGVARPRGIAVDEQTALLIDEQGSGQVVSPAGGRVYFLQAPGAAETCAPRAPLTYRNVAVYRVPAGGKFDLVRWTGTGGSAYTVGAEAGVLTWSGNPEGPY